MIKSISSYYDETFYDDINAPVYCRGKIIDTEQESEPKIAVLYLGKNSYKKSRYVTVEAPLPSIIEENPEDTICLALSKGSKKHFEEIIVKTEDLFNAIVDTYNFGKEIIDVHKKYLLHSVIKNNLGVKKTVGFLNLIDAITSDVRVIDNDFSCQISGEPLGLPYEILVHRSNRSPYIVQLIPYSEIHKKAQLSINKIKFTWPVLTEKNQQAEIEKIKKNVKFYLKKYKNTFKYNLNKLEQGKSTFISIKDFSSILHEEIADLKFCKINNTLQILLTPFCDLFKEFMGSQKELYSSFCIWKQGVKKKEMKRVNTLTPYLSLRSYGSTIDYRERAQRNVILEACLIATMMRRNRYINRSISPYVATFNKTDAVELVAERFSSDLRTYFDEDKTQRSLDNETETVHKNLTLARMLLYCLKDIHETGIVHHDIKLENILVQVNQKNDITGVRICDFGLSNMNGVFDRGLKGTDHFLSPEVVYNFLTENEYQLNSAIDVWSMGAVLFSVFGGCRRDLFDEHARLVKKFRSAYIARPNYHQKLYDEYLLSSSKKIKAFLEVHPGYGTFLLRMLEPDPDERISVDEAIHEIDEILARNELEV